MTNCHIYWHSMFNKCQRHVEFKFILDNLSLSVMLLHMATEWADTVHISFPVMLYLFQVMLFQLKSIEVLLGPQCCAANCQGKALHSILSFLLHPRCGGF